MKKLFFLLVVLLSIQSQSQTYVKVNALTTLLTIPNVRKPVLAKKSTFQLDILGSPWKSINGKPQQFYVVNSRISLPKKIQWLLCWAHIEVLYLISRNGTI
jgi:hypothetical protein